MVSQSNREELGLSRDELNTVLNTISDGITVQRRDGSLVYANSSAAELTGFDSVEQMLSTPVTEIISRFELFDEDGNSISPAQLPGREVLQGKEAKERLVRFRVLESGEEHWALVRARPIYDKDGNVNEVVNSFQNVTGQQRALAAERTTRAQVEAAQQRLEFLSRTSAMLSRSLDYHTTLRRLARLTVPWLADWCGVDLLQEDGSIDRVAVAHVDPAKVDLAYELRKRYPSDPNADTPARSVLKTGEVYTIPLITDEMLVQAARDERHLELMRSLQLHSMILVPLKGREGPMGMLTLASAESQRRFSEHDVALAEELARRAAVAVENARLYSQVTRYNEELEARVAQRTKELAEAQQIAKVGSWAWEVATNKVTWSDEMYRIYGISPDEFDDTYEAFLERVEPEDRDHVDQVVRASFENHRPFSYYERIRLPDGTMRILHSHGKVETDDEGNVARLMGTCQDITELKQTEQALRQSEALYRSIAQNLPSGAVFVVDRDLRYRLAEGPILSRLGIYDDDGAIEGKTIYEALPEDEARGRVEWYQRALDGESVSGELPVGNRTILVQMTPLYDDQDQVYAALALAQDISERKEAEETMRSLLRLSSRLTATLDLDSLMGLLTEEALALTRSKSGCSGLYKSGGFVTHTYHRDGESIPLEKVWLPGQGIPGWLIEHKQPYLTNDAQSDPLVIPEICELLEIETVLSTPVLDSNGELLAFFEVSNKEDGTGFTESDREKLVGLSQIASIAIQNAQSYERMRDLSRKIVHAQEEERRRLSRELHDSAGQVLTALQINLSMLASSLPDQTLQRQVQDAAEMASATHDEIRAASHALRPPALEMVGLNATLQSLCRDFAKQAGLQIEYEGVEVDSVPDQISISFYRFVQEALTNVARHAQARSVRVHLNNDHGELHITVEDDGIGIADRRFMESSTISGGVGLLGLRERFELIGGQVQVESDKGRGTRVAARCPIT